MTLTVCSYKLACSHRSGLKLLGKVVANISSGEMLRRPLLQRAGGSSLLGGGLELGILSVLASSDFPEIDLVKKSSITGFAVSTNVDYGKHIIRIDQSQENYRKCLFVVKEKRTTVMWCLYLSVFAINSSNAVREMS